MPTIKVEETGLIDKFFSEFVDILHTDLYLKIKTCGENLKERGLSESQYLR